MSDNSIITSNDCYVNIEVSSQQELFEYFYNIFLQKNYVQPSFLNSIIERESKYPTAIELADSVSIAIPHTDSEHVKVLKIVPCLLKDNIKFSVMGNKNKQTWVKIVFFLLINEKHDHIDILRNIIALCSNQENINAILNCKTNTELFGLLINHFK